MRVDEIQSKFDFRKMDGHWERRNIHGGHWFRLHVERVEPVTTVNSAERGPRQIVLPARNEWSWR